MLVVSTANRTRHGTTSNYLIAGTAERATKATSFCFSCPPVARVSLGLDEYIDRFGTHRLPTVLLTVAASPTAFL